jgi:hypothetical protein
MRETGAPSTEEAVSVSCARPTGGRHGRTTDAPEQRFNGVNLRGTLEVGRTDTYEEWRDVWDSFQEESPKLRAALEEEFRAVLGNYRMNLWGRRRRGREVSKLLREPVVKSPQSHENRQ